MESPESWFHRRATFYVETQILFHLNQVGVVKLLSQGAAYTAPEIATRLQLDEGATSALLDYVLAVDELFERDGQGRYSLSEFGHNVVARFSSKKANNEPPAINMFDVRVGAYGPVWQNLTRILNRSGSYGTDFHRDGRYAETGVSKLAGNFWSGLIDHIEECGAGTVVEIGLTTGLLERLAEKYPEHALYGLDRSKRIIDDSVASAESRRIRNIRFINDDYFEPDRWCRAVDAGKNGLIYSLHFHELMAHGDAKFVETLRKLKSLLPNWAVLAFEQPRLPREDKAKVPETLWMYAQSNILIHHLIGNGKILTAEAWMDLGRQAGCTGVRTRPCNYLGYEAYLYHL